MPTRSGKRRVETDPRPAPRAPQTPSEAPSTLPSPAEIAVGRVVRGAGGRVLVAHPDIADGPRPPIATSVALGPEHVGRSVALLFDHGHPARPIVVGLLRDEELTAEGPESVELDGESLVLSAEREIVLRCGKSSLTLTRDGKVLIRGAYVVSRSSGPNRIKGGSVQIN